MATVLDSLVVQLGFRVDTRSLRRAEQRIQATRDKLDNFASGALRVGTVLTAALVGTLVPFATVETELAKIEGLVGVSRDQLNAWKRDLDAIAVETGQGPDKLAQALFFITSAGLRGQAAIDVLRQSAKAAAAGLGNQATIADLLTSAMNAYGQETLSARQATDALTEAVRLGKLEPASLANAMGRVLPIASAMGVQFKEVAGLLAAMSKTGTTAEEGVTQLSAIMAGLLKPTDQAEKALATVGLTAGGLRDAIGERGLFQAIQMIHTAFNGAEDAMAEVFPNIRALRGLFDLLGPQMASNIELLDEMADSTGVLDEAFGASAQTLQASWNRALASSKIFLIDIGARLAPLAKQVLEFATNAVKAFNQMPEGIKNVIAGLLLAGPVLLGLAAAAKVASLALGFFAPLMTVIGVAGKGAVVVFGLIKAAMVALGIAAGTISLPILLAVAAIAASVALIYAYWEPIKGFFSQLWANIAANSARSLERVKLLLSGIADFSFSLYDAGAAMIQTLIDGIKSAPGAVYEALKGILSDARDLLPFSDAKEGPLSELTRSGQAIIDTLARCRGAAISLPILLAGGRLSLDLWRFRPLIYAVLGADQGGFSFSWRAWHNAANVEQAVQLDHGGSYTAARC